MLKKVTFFSEQEGFSLQLAFSKVPNFDLSPCQRLEEKLVGHPYVLHPLVELYGHRVLQQKVGEVPGHGHILHPLVHGEGVGHGRVGEVGTDQVQVVLSRAEPVLTNELVCKYIILFQKKSAPLQVVVSVDAGQEKVWQFVALHDVGAVGSISISIFSNVILKLESVGKYCMAILAKAE